MAFESPEAPELVASAASIMTTVPCVDLGQPHALFQAGEPGLHPVALLPELLGQAQGFALGALGIAVDDDDAVAAQVGHVGERIADEHAGGQAARALLDVPAPGRRSGRRRRWR